MSAKLTHALGLSARGLRVFPVRPGAKDPPLVDHFPEDATTDAAAIERWWRQWPNANIAVCTNDLLVLDVDPAKGGLDSLRMLVACNDDLPNSLTASTGRGGAHLYYNTAMPVACSVGRLGPGLDVRAWRGYVIAPGSSIPEGDYTIAQDAPIAPAPQWLVDLAGVPVERKPVSQAIEELDGDQALKRAVDYLQNAAPLAIQGANGDATTYQVAARLLDFGLSPDGAYEAMQENWNERCSPPWSPEELERKIGNAAKYRQDPIGSRDPRLDFDVVDVAPPPAAQAEQKPLTSLPAPRPALDFDVAKLRQRDWVLDGLALRGYVTEIVAPPGAGKSTLTLELAAALASGKEITGHSLRFRGRAWLYNNEDDEPELMRRLEAVRRHFNLSNDDLPKDRLFVNSGRHRPLTIAKRAVKGGVEKLFAADVAALIGFVKEHSIDLLIVDPFAETHEGSENDNVETLQVARMYRQVAQEGDCAVVLVHHTRKLPAGSSEGHAGNMDSGRGASALAGVARVIVTLYGMSLKDAKKHGVHPDQRNRYVRLDDAKANLSLASGKARWFRRESVPVPAVAVPLRHPGDMLPGGNIPVGAVDEAVGVLVPVSMADVEVEQGPLALSGQALDVWACLTHLSKGGAPVSRKALRAEYDRRVDGQPGRQMSADARKKALHRAIEILANKGVVTGTSTHVLLQIECPPADDPFMSPECPAASSTGAKEAQKSADFLN